MLMKKEVIEDNENLKKEIKDLKKQLEEEKNAYNRMYNMYVEKDNIINELEEDIEDALKEARANNYHMGEWDNNNRGRYDAYLYVYDKLQELKGSNNNE